jgi:hypothetical protein
MTDSMSYLPYDRMFIFRNASEYILTVTDEIPWTHEYDVDPGLWLQALRPQMADAIIWYFKFKQANPDYERGDYKIFARAFWGGGHEDRDAPRSWVTVMRRAVGDYVPPRRGSNKEILTKVFSHLAFDESDYLTKKYVKTPAMTMPETV